MKRLFICLAAVIFGASFAFAQNSVSVLGSYQSAEGEPDFENCNSGEGWLVRYQYDPKPEATSLRFLLQAGKLTGFGYDYEYHSDVVNSSDKFGLNLTAVEAAVLFDCINKSGWAIYGGLGFGYYIPDISYERNESISMFLIKDESSAEADNAVGQFVLAGVEKKIGRGFALFAEARFNMLEIPVRKTNRSTMMSLFDGHKDDLLALVALPYDISGIGASAGLSYVW